MTILACRKMLYLHKSFRSMVVHGYRARCPDADTPDTRRPSSRTVGGYPSEGIGQGGGNDGNAQHLDHVGEPREVLVGVRAVDVEKPTAVGAQILDALQGGYPLSLTHFLGERRSKRKKKEKYGQHFEDLPTRWLAYWSKQRDERTLRSSYQAEEKNQTQGG